MPFDRYECQHCGDKFLFFSKLWEKEREVRCPRCGSEVKGSSSAKDTGKPENSGTCELQTNRESS